MFAEGALVNRKYRILAELGQGSLGLSYKALVLGSNSVCAIKVLDNSLVPSQVPMELVEQAVAKSSELRHSVALRWQAVEQGEAGETILVREFVEGPSLKSVLVDRTPFAVARACRIVRQIALAVDAAQRLKMVHGDLRPQNILLCNSDGEEKVRILDFGMVRLRENFTYSLHRLTLKNSGPMMGDPQYLSPEQATGLRGDSLDTRSDIYSLGIIFCQLLTGQLPSPAGSPLDSLMWHILGAPPNLCECYPDLTIPQDLSQLVCQMLAKPREKRLESARVVAQRLEIFEGLHSRARAKAIEAPSFALLSDRNKVKPAVKSVERAAPKAKPTPTAIPEVIPSPLTPAAASRVGAVEIAPIRPLAAKPIASPERPRRSSRGWVIAASILIVIGGLGAAGYHFRSSIPWAAVKVNRASFRFWRGRGTARRAPTHAAKVNPAQFQFWGQRLEAGLRTSFHRIEGGVQAWSRKVEQQLASRRPASAPAAVPAQPATSATPPPVVAQASSPPAENPDSSSAANGPSAKDTTPAAKPPTTAASQAPPSDQSGSTLAELNKNPAPPPVTGDHSAANDSNPPPESHPAEVDRVRQSHPKAPKAASQRPSASAALDSATVARMVSTDLANGDASFELGQYDQAIRDYRQGLALDPANKVLPGRIARAKRAQAAEAEFLNQ